jgi:polyhydroxyalkanoate synthesis regulator phasin
MLDLMKKTMLTGIGLALLAKDEMEELAREVVEKGKMTEKDGKKFLNDLQERYEDVQKADVVTADELKALKKEIRELKKALNKDAGASG